MKTVKIKCLFPYNYYHARDVEVKVNRQIVGKIGHGDELELKINSHDSITFSLDFFKSVVNPSKQEDPVHIVIYFKFRDYFPFNVTDFFNRKALKTIEVTASEYEYFSMNVYNRKSSFYQYFKYDMVSIIIGIALSVFFICCPIIYSTNKLSEIASLFGLLNLIGFLVLSLERKKISFKQYRSRQLIAAILGLILLFFLEIDFVVKAISMFVSLFLIVRLAYLTMFIRKSV